MIDLDKLDPAKAGKPNCAWEEGWVAALASDEVRALVAIGKSLQAEDAAERAFHEAIMNLPSGTHLDASQNALCDKMDAARQLVGSLVFEHLLPAQPERTP